VPTVCHRDEAAFVRDRAESVFEAATLVKPDRSAGDHPANALAPLIVRRAAGGGEETGGAGGKGGDFPADDYPSDDGVLAPEEVQAVVRAEYSTVVLEGVEHPQWVYAWDFPTGETAPESLLAYYRLRITLGADGFPAVWEIFAGDTDTPLIFVSQSLEAAARDEHGPPLPGCRYAVERPAHDAPGAIVVRVLDDGPMPMGPMVYLDDATRTVFTLLCRCMPSQVNQITGTAYYELQPSDGFSDFDGFDGPVGGGDFGAATSAEWADPAWLEHALRLPSAF
jgi:hypothetical protein